LRYLTRKKVAGKFGYSDLEALDRQAYHAVLATVQDERPYTSLIAYAYDPERKSFIFITPRKTNKYANICSNNNVSLLIDTREHPKSHYLKGEAYTIVGKATRLRKGKSRDRSTNVFLKKHPELKDFSNSPDVAIVSVSIDFCMKVSNFQEVYILEGK